jgi:hypothetical protein
MTECCKKLFVAAGVLALSLFSWANFNGKSILGSDEQSRENKGSGYARAYHK